MTNTPKVAMIKSNYQTTEMSRRMNDEEQDKGEENVIT